jgi:hypothetical protein
MEQLLVTVGILFNNTSKILFLLGGGAVALSALMMQSIARIRGSFKPYQKTTLLYLLVAVLFFAIAGLTTHPQILVEPSGYFIFYQGCFLLYGIMNYYLIPRYLKWSNDDNSFWQELLFTLTAALLGGIAFISLYHSFNQDELEYIMASSILTFLIPFLFYQAFKKAVAIPPKIRKQWLYPVHEEIEEPDEKKLKNMLIISFEFEKQTEDLHFTNFRAKAPTDMEFGQLFYYFINDYNERHPNSKIEFISGSGASHGWIFYKKPRWHSVFTQYIDAEKTIYNNHIKENEVIICTRTIN